MSLDKKARGARLRMVILDGVGNPIIYDSPPEDLLDAGLPGGGRMTAGSAGARAQRAQPRPPRQARAVGLRHGDLRRPGRLCLRTGKELGLDVEVRQTEYEGELVTWIHQACDDQTPVVLNAGALTHYSYALMDAVKMRTAPLVEVHISNIAAREGFRHESVITGAATGIIAGFGFQSYVLALRAIAEQIR